MSVIVYEDTDGTLYGFCSPACLDFWRQYTKAPLAMPELHKPPDKGSECGCWWCGADLMQQKGIEWIQA